MNKHRVVTSCMTCLVEADVSKFGEFDKMDYSHKLIISSTSVNFKHENQKISLITS